MGMVGKREVWRAPLVVVVVVGGGCICKSLPPGAFEASQRPKCNSRTARNGTHGERWDTGGDGEAACLVEAVRTNLGSDQRCSHREAHNGPLQLQDIRERRPRAAPGGRGRLSETEYVLGEG